MASKDKRCAHCGSEYESTALFCPRDGKPLEAHSKRVGETEDDPFIGLQLEGGIEVLALVGVGAMGRVYRARQHDLERDVAVKILRPDLSDDAHLVERFHREAKIASRLSHPGVVRVFLSGTIEPDALPKKGAYAAGSVYLVMEFLDGISLLSALNAAGAEGGRGLPVRRALHIVLQICDAVAEAHQVGIVHRDLKPENVMLVARAGARDAVKVLDFGIARLVDERSKFSREGLVFGSAAYISPEGAEGLDVDARADVYAIATLLYECLAGHTPFHDEPPVRILLKQVSGEPPPLAGLPHASHVPASLAELVMDNLGKEPESRAPDAGALRKRLRAAVRSAGIDAASLGVDDDVRLPAHQTTRAVGALRLDAPSEPVASIDIPLDSLEEERTETMPSVRAYDASELLGDAADEAPESSDRGLDLGRTQKSRAADHAPAMLGGATLRSDINSAEKETLKAAAKAMRAEPVRIGIKEASELPEAGPSEKAPDSGSPLPPSVSEPPPPSSGTVRRRAILRRRKRNRRRLVAAAAGGLLVAVGFLVGRTQQKPPARGPSPGVVHACVDRAGCDVEAALAKYRAGQPARSGRKLERQVAERLVADALRLKYAGRDMDAARRLAAARRIAPGLELARDLAARWAGAKGSAEAAP